MLDASLSPDKEPLPDCRTSDPKLLGAKCRILQSLPTRTPVDYRDRAPKAHTRFHPTSPMRTWLEESVGNKERIREDIERTRHVYMECLKLIPHKEFSFAKIWLVAAQFEIRLLNLMGARRILGQAIGKAPKHKIFSKYIKIELQLGSIDRCRKLYEKYLEWSPEIAMLGEQESLRIQCLQNARRVFESANNYFRESTPGLREERAMLLQELLNLEKSFAKLGDESLVLVKMPKKLRKRKLVYSVDGRPAGYDEYLPRRNLGLKYEDFGSCLQRMKENLIKLKEVNLNLNREISRRKMGEYLDGMNFDELSSLEDKMEETLMTIHEKKVGFT
ncbi:hypothetical protein AgCh_032745 [Apium graveolens]